MPSYSSRRPTAYQSAWGMVSTFPCPSAIVIDETLGLQPVAVKVLLVFYQIVKRRRMLEAVATVTVKQSTLLDRTGCKSRTTIEKALRELEAKHFIQVKRGNKKKNLQLASNGYVLLNPQTRTGLVPKTGESLLLGNGLRYFNVPDSFLADSDAPYSIAKISSGAMAVYTAALFEANRGRCLEFSMGRINLRKLSGLKDNRTLGRAIEELRDVRLLWIEEKGTTLEVELQDPQTGSPAYKPTGDDRDDPASYRVVEEGGKGRRLVSSQGTPEQRTTLIRSLFQKHGKLTIKPDGQMKVVCCFHDDNNPSLNIRTEPRFCFNCFGCNKYGSDITDIVMAVHGCQRAEATQIVADAFGHEVRFEARLRPKEGELRYIYRDENGKPVKMLRRFIDPKTGKKDFDQWTPVPGGYKSGIQGVGPCMYRAAPLAIADTVVVVEGEKEVDTITGLDLRSSGGEVLGITTGGSDSWDPSLAIKFKGKRVIVMPDADIPGKKYECAVVASLKAVGIEHALVSFTGTGHNDVTDYVETHGREALVQHMRQSTYWIDGSHLIEPEFIETV